VAEPADAPGRRNPLPEGTLAVGVGLLLSGITTYGFLILAARALGKDAYAPLGLLWTAVFLLGPGLFIPLEQEVSRALAERGARGVGGGPVIRRAGALALALLAVLLLVMAALAPVLLDQLFEDQELLLVGLGLGLVGIAAGHLARGACSGQGRFRPYSVFLGADGVVRLLLCIGLVVAGVDTPGPYGLAVGLAPCIAVFIALARERGLLQDGPETTWREVSRALVALLLGSILSFTLINGSPLAIRLLGTEAEQADAGRFLNGLIIARVPLFLFQAVQASLLPRLSSLAGAGKLAEFRTGLRSLILVTAAIGAVAAVGAFAVGPFAVRILFGAEFELDHRTLGLLALGCALYMVASALSQAVIALGGHRLVAASWAAGVAGFVGGCAFAAEDLFLRVELGLVLGSASATISMAASLSSRLASGAQLSHGAVIEALHEIPLDP
jgi:O-antigen/teichoic acid export membrane protein